MTHRYWRCDWAHRRAAEPVIIFYEVTPDGDVWRLVEVFAGAPACER